jgi:hypothetical protein
MKRPALFAQPEPVSIDNRLPPAHPQRVEIENAIRSGLAGLPGPWDVVVRAPSAGGLVIAVVAPDASAWTWMTSCCAPQYTGPEAIADTIRAVCGRRRGLDAQGTPNPSPRQEHEISRSKHATGTERQ